MVDDLDGGLGAHATDRLDALGVHQDHLVDAPLGQVLETDERQHLRVLGEKRLEVAVHLARQDGGRVGIEAGGGQHARQRIEIGVLVRQDNADGLIGNGHRASLNATQHLSTDRDLRGFRNLGGLCPVIENLRAR